MFRDDSNQVATKTSFKPHSNFLYAHPNSDHPAHMWKALVRGELMRGHRACSDRQDAYSHARFLVSRFSHRCYCSKTLWSAYDEIARMPRTSLLSSSERSSERHIYVAKYHLAQASLPRHIRRIWREIEQSGSPRNDDRVVSP